MARAVVRVVVGLLLALAVGLMLAPLLPTAEAQPGDLAALPQTIPTITVPKVTTTITVTTAPPSTSSVSTTPTTKVRARASATTVTTGAPAPTTTTSTTLAPLPAPAPPPVTLPLGVATQSGSISAFFPILSGIGFFCLAALLTAQWFLTTPGRKGPTL